MFFIFSFFIIKKRVFYDKNRLFLYSNNTTSEGN